MFSIRLQLLILQELAKSRKRIGPRLTLHYLGESEVDGGVIGRCIILGGLILRFRAWSAEEARSFAPADPSSYDPADLNNFGPAIQEGLEEFLCGKSPPLSPYAKAHVQVRTRLDHGALRG